MTDNLERDIEKWIMDRLAVWFRDSMSRYEMIGKESDMAETDLVMMMLSTVAGMLATRTTCDPQLVGKHFANMIAGIRANEQKRKARNG